MLIILQCNNTKLAILKMHDPHICDKKISNSEYDNLIKAIAQFKSQIESDNPTTNVDLLQKLQLINLELQYVECATPVNNNYNTGIDQGTQIATQYSYMFYQPANMTITTTEDLTSYLKIFKKNKEKHEKICNHIVDLYQAINTKYQNYNLDINNYTKSIAIPDNIFKLAQEQIIKKLTNIHSEIMNAETIIQVIREQTNSTDEFTNIDNEIKKLKENIIVMKINQTKQQITKIQQEIDQLAKDKCQLEATHKEEIIQLCKKITDTTQNYDQQLKDIQDNINRLRQEQEQSILQYDTSQCVNDNDITNPSIKDDIIKYTKQKTEITQTIDKYKKEILSHSEKAESLEKEIKTEQDKLKNFTILDNQYQHKGSKLDSDISAYQNTIKTYNNEKSNIQNYIDKLNGIRGQAQANIKNLSSKITNFESEMYTSLKKTNLEFNQLEQNHKTLSLEIPKLIEQISATHTEICSLNDKIKQLQENTIGRSAALLETISQLEKQIKVIEETIADAEQNPQATSQTHNTLIPQPNTETISQLNKQLTDAKQQLEDINQQKVILATSEEQCKQQTQNRTQLQSELRDKQQTLKTITEQQQKLQRPSSTLTKKKEERERQYKNIAGYNDTINTLSKQLSEQETKISTQTQQLDQLRDYKNNKQRLTTKDAFEKKIATLQGQLQDINQLKETNQSKITALEKTLEDITLRQQKLLSSIDPDQLKKERQIKELEEQSQNITTDKELLPNQEKACRQKYDNDVNAVTSKITSHTKRLTELTEHMNSLNINTQSSTTQMIDQQIQVSYKIYSSIIEQYKNLQNEKQQLKTDLISKQGEIIDKEKLIDEQEQQIQNNQYNQAQAEDNIQQGEILTAQLNELNEKLTFTPNDTTLQQEIKELTQKISNNQDDIYSDHQNKLVLDSCKQSIQGYKTDIIAIQSQIKTLQNQQKINTQNIQNLCTTDDGQILQQLIELETKTIKTIIKEHITIEKIHDEINTMINDELNTLNKKELLKKILDTQSSYNTHLTNMFSAATNQKEHIQASIETESPHITQATKQKEIECNNLNLNHEKLLEQERARNELNRKIQELTTQLNKPNSWIKKKKIGILFTIYTSITFGILRAVSYFTNKNKQDEIAPDISDDSLEDNKEDIINDNNQLNDTQIDDIDDNQEDTNR